MLLANVWPRPLWVELPLVPLVPLLFLEVPTELRLPRLLLCMPAPEETAFCVESVSALVRLGVTAVLPQPLPRALPGALPLLRARPALGDLVPLLELLLIIPLLPLLVLPYLHWI